jgi:hypothetical protein
VDGSMIKSLIIISNYYHWTIQIVIFLPLSSFPAIYNVGLNLLNHGSRFSSFFLNLYSSHIFLQDLDISRYSKIFIPIHHQSNHWCLLVINIQKNQIEFYDSLGSKGMEYRNVCFIFFKIISLTYFKRQSLYF